MQMSTIIENTIYFLALINPASKILFLCSKEPPYLAKEVRAVSFKSSFVAWIILIILIASGNFVLSSIFHVQIYSLSVAGGIILFIIGLNAVRNGNFYEKADFGKAADVSIVPLAAPLIAGPGVMTAAISFASMHGITVTLICVSLGILINLMFMLMSLRIGRFLERINATGAVIRITGLIVTSVAMQMIFSGCAMWVHRLM
jgi:multiple antibiotic resistance protein